MMQKIKDIGYTALGMAFLLGFMLLFAFFLHGGLWFFSTFSETLKVVNLALLALSALLLFCSLYPSFRKISGSGMIIASWVIGAIFWLTSLFVTYSLLGVFWIVVGLLFAGIGVVPLAGIALLLHKQFSLFGWFILSGALIFIFRFVGIRIVDKFRVVKPVKNKVIRYVIAVFAGFVIGNAISLPIFIALDSIFGSNTNTITGSLSFMLIVYMVLIGFVTGFSAAVIAQERGRTIAIFAQFAPLVLIIGLSILLNHDLASYSGVKPAVWTWIGLIPAIAGGYYGEKYIRSEASEIVSSMV